MSSTSTNSDLIRWPGEVPVFQNATTAPAADSAPADIKPDLKSAIDSWCTGGIRANRHGCPDLIGQLERACSVAVDTILCSALDDEPDLRLNAAITAGNYPLVVAAVKQLGKLTGAKRMWIAVEGGAPAAWDGALRESAKVAGVTIVELPNDYPQADPTLLLYTLTNRRLRPADLPVERGVVLLDAPAAVAIARGRMGTVPVAALDHRSHEAVYMEAPTGTRLADALPKTMGMSGSLFLGGDWRRDRRLSPDYAMDGRELAIHVMPRRQSVNSQPCVRCGWCAHVCPTGVAPALVLEAAQRADKVMASAAGAAACIECGLCDQVCPSNLPLLGALREIR